MRNITRALSRQWLSLLAAGFTLGSLALPSQVVVYQAENYTNFYDTTPGNSGGALRNDAVDIEVTSDSGGGRKKT